MEPETSTSTLALAKMVHCQHFVPVKYEYEPGFLFLVLPVYFLSFQMKYFNYFGYDVMGDLAFGNDFGMLSSGEEHFAVNLLNEGMQPMAMLFPTWFFRTLTAIPQLAAGYWKFIAYCSQQLDNRLNVCMQIFPDYCKI